MQSRLLAFIAGVALCQTVHWAVSNPEPVALAPTEEQAPREVALVEVDVPRAEPASCPAPTEGEALVRAVSLGCDCPIPPPEDLAYEFTEEGVEGWFDELAERCPAFQGRALDLNCDEFPCIAYIELKERSESVSPHLETLLCLDQVEAPEFKYLGVSMITTHEGMVFDQVLVIKPKDEHAYNRRISVRMEDR